MIACTPRVSNSWASVKARFGNSGTDVSSDIVMPRKEGFETIEELRRRHPGVKIIAISGGDRHRGSGTLTVAKGLGAHGVLMKPFRRQELLAMIDDILPTA